MMIIIIIIIIIILIKITIITALITISLISLLHDITTFVILRYRQMKTLKKYFLTKNLFWSICHGSYGKELTTMWIKPTNTNL